MDHHYFAQTSFLKVVYVMWSCMCPILGPKPAALARVRATCSLGEDLLDSWELVPRGSYPSPPFQHISVHSVPIWSLPRTLGTEIMNPETSKAGWVCNEKFDVWTVISCLSTYVAGCGLFNPPLNKYHHPPKFWPYQAIHKALLPPNLPAWAAVAFAALTCLK